MATMVAAISVPERLHSRGESQEGPLHGEPRSDPAPHEARPATTESPPLQAVHTPNFPELLWQLGASLLVTTYQAGKLVLVRDEGDHLNAHFRSFPAPMGMALDGDRLAIGTTTQVWEFVNVPAVAARLEPPGRHDACYLPRASHFTGNIQIHEMAWGKSEVGDQRAEIRGQRSEGRDQRAEIRGQK
jgi:hypothetical protein